MFSFIVWLPRVPFQGLGVVFMLSQDIYFFDKNESIHFSKEKICLMVKNSSGKEFSTKLTWIFIFLNENSQPSGRVFYLLEGCKKLWERR
ncbi:hypothetical protein HR11_03165 [Porphyromonas macacae]|nr:hypothetical protein HR11_03165 [Porphyromonas macacae]